MKRESEPARSLARCVMYAKIKSECAAVRRHIYRRSKELLRRPKNPDRALASLAAELVESFRADLGREDVQFPAPPRPTCQTPPSFIFLSRVFWRSSSSSKEKTGRSLMARILPAPPRPALYDDAAGSPALSAEAGPRAVLPSVQFLGARKVLPAPPRPEWR